MSKGIEKLNKRYSGFIQLPGSYPMESIKYLPTGSLALDYAIGKPWERSGIPLGMITVIWGKEGSGKTTLLKSILANAQKYDDRMVALGDTELKVDFDYDKTIGIDFSRLTLMQPDSSRDVYGEQIVEGMVELVKTGDYSVVACDSLASLIPKVLVESDVTEHLPGVHARLVSRLFSKIVEKAKHTNTAIVLTSQRRANFGGQSFAGSSYNIVGGNAMKFGDCLQMKMAMMKRVKDGDDVVGILSKVELEKNTGIAYRSANIYITYGRGLDSTRELFLDLGKPYGIAYNRSSWYYYTNVETGEEVAVAQGARKTGEYLRDNPELMEELQNRVMVALEGEYGDKSG